MADYNEGDSVSNENGDTLVLTNGQWVPTVGTDLKKSVMPDLGRAATGAMTLPGTMANMAAKGIDAAGDYMFPDWKQSIPGQAAGYYSKATEPYTYDATMKRLEDQHGGPYYSPQTTTGKVAEGAIGALPMAAMGGESLPLNVVRALVSGAASKAAGEATKDTPYEIPARVGTGMLAYGAPGALQRPSINPTNTRGVFAQRLEQAGVPVSAADISGGKTMAALEGQPPAGQQQALSDAMLNTAGVSRTGTQSMPEALAQRQTQLQHTVQNDLGPNTSIPNHPAIDQALARQVAGHLATTAGTSLENPAVEQGLNDYRNLQQAGSINGRQYQALREQWNSSGDPTLRRMATTLDAAMDGATQNTPYQGAWNNWRQNWADLKGLQGASDAAGGSASLQPLSPKRVVDSMYSNTPMRQLAEAGHGIVEDRPQPPDMSTIKNLGHVAGALGGAVGLTHGTEAGLAGAIVPEVIAQGVPSALALTQPAFRSAAGQRIIRNMDPKLAAAILANEGVQSKDSTAEQPSQ